MRDLTKIYRAGRVRRWHANPDLAHTDDRIDGHSARVARIILARHPAPSFDLIRAALIHDDGESVTGDVPAEAKRMFPALARALKGAEAQAVLRLWGTLPDANLTARDLEWMKFADRLDAYMWAQAHRPDILAADGWPEDFDTLTALAAELGVSYALRGATGQVEDAA